MNISGSEPMSIDTTQERFQESDWNAVAVSRPTEVFAAKTCCLGEEQVVSLNFSLKTDYSEEHKGELVKGPGWDKSISHYRQKKGIVLFHVWVVEL